MMSVCLMPGGCFVRFCHFYSIVAMYHIMERGLFLAWELVLVMGEGGCLRMGQVGEAGWCVKSRAWEALGAMADPACAVYIYQDQHERCI